MKTINKECSDVNNFVNFSCKQKQDVFANISTATASLKCKIPDGLHIIKSTSLALEGVHRRLSLYEVLTRSQKGTYK